jgi:hypothetical protein
MCAVAPATGKSGGVLIGRASHVAVRERITSGTFNELFEVPAQTLRQASV